MDQNIQQFGCEVLASADRHNLDTASFLTALSALASFLLFTQSKNDSARARATAIFVSSVINNAHVSLPTLPQEAAHSTFGFGTRH